MLLKNAGNLKNKKGFSLIELLIAMTALLIIAAAFISSFFIAALINNKAANNTSATYIAIDQTEQILKLGSAFLPKGQVLSGLEQGINFTDAVPFTKISTEPDVYQKQITKENKTYWIRVRFNPSFTVNGQPVYDNEGLLRYIVEVFDQAPNTEGVKYIAHTEDFLKIQP